jgi:hypothetical protein
LISQRVNSMEDSPMRTVRQLLILPLALLTIVSSPAFADLPDQNARADQHLVTPGDLAAAVAQHVSSQDAERAAIHEALGRPEVRSVASSMHVDLTRAAAAVDTMSGADLAQAASAARNVNHQLAGGASTVVISTTTIIIILLLVIILIIAVK